MMLRNLSFTVVICLVSVLWSFAQTTQSEPINPPTLNQIIEQTFVQTLNYQAEFRNLLALETKTFTEFDKNEQAKKKTTVESNFLVYQSSKNNKLSFELRNILKVDEKPIPKSEENADLFFAELNKTSTLKSELEKIEKKGSKYDKTLDISGLTLYEGIILSDNIRPSFDFQFIGTENYQGTDVYLIGYQQKAISPFIRINGKGEMNQPNLDFSADVPREFRKNNIFLRGKFWIDAKTFQLWREERQLAIMANEPLILMQTNLEYQQSNYGLLVPKLISLLSNKIKKKDGKFVSLKDIQVDFAYNQFRKTETDVKILDDDTQ